MTATTHHAYLHCTNEALFLVASGSEDFVVGAMQDYLSDHEPHSEDRMGAWRRHLMKQPDSTAAARARGTFSSAVDPRP